jgi:ribonuclease T2
MKYSCLCRPYHSHKEIEVQVKSLVLRTSLFIVTLLLASLSRAEVKFDGYFIANNNNCPAYQSFRKKTNPGDIHLTEDMAYEVLSKNKFEATHYRLRIKDASPKERWVAKECGTLLTDCNQSKSEGNGEDQTSSADEYLLALSWQPAFCQTHQSKVECQTQVDGRYDATHLTLHGLWPQPKSNIYCNVPAAYKKLDQHGAWSQLPSLELSEDLFSELIEIMPGVSSHLQRHEWTKHGTCYSETATEYFSESLQLALEINNSSVRELFADHIGETLSADQIKNQFDIAFGEGAGDKLKIRCDRGMISELWINLKGNIDESTPINTLMDKAPNAGSSCQSGLVDRVGY